MSLTRHLEELSSLLAAHPEIEEQPDLAEACTRLTAAIEHLQAEHTALGRRRRVLALDLIAAIGNNHRSTPEWLTANSPSGRQYQHANRQDLEEFAEEAIQHGRARQLIDELSGHRQRWTTLLGELLKLTETEADERLNELDDAALLEFCEANGIRASISKKGPINRRRTVTNIAQKMVELRAFLSLSAPGR